MSTEVYYVVVDADGDEGIVEYDTVEEAIAEAKELGWPAVKSHTYAGGDRVNCRYVWPLQAVVP